MKLINCGCSFAHGHKGTPLIDYTPVKQAGLADPDIAGFESAGWYLSQSFGMEYVDLARNGYSNEAILRTLRTYLHKNPKENLFVLIGWTHAFRREYISWNIKKNEGESIQYREIPMANSLFSKLANKFHKGKIGPMMVEFNERNNRPLSYDDHVEFRKYNIVLQTQQMLKLFGIPYLMYNGCGNEHSSTNIEILEIKEQIDQNNYYCFDTASFDQYVLKHSEFLSEDRGHPSSLGQKRYADLMAPYFQKILTK
jgi:hypothetical protein